MVCSSFTFFPLSSSRCSNCHRLPKKKEGGKKVSALMVTSEASEWIKVLYRVKCSSICYNFTFSLSPSLPLSLSPSLPLSLSLSLSLSLVLWHLDSFVPLSSPSRSLCVTVLQEQFNMWRRKLTETISDTWSPTRSNIRVLVLDVWNSNNTSAICHWSYK